MKKSYSLPALCVALAFTVVACGKKDNSAAVGQGVVAVAPVQTIYPVPTYTGNPISLQQYCQMYGGSFNGTTCSITQQYGGGSQWLSVQIGTFSTGIPIYAGQRVGVSASSGTQLYVGGTSIGSGSVNVVASVSGMLTYSISSLSFNSGIQMVQVTTCLNAPGQAVACP